MNIFQSVTQAYSEKINPSSSNISLTYELPITDCSSDTFPLIMSSRRYVVARP